MVKVDEAFEVRYKFAGEKFEVLVDFDKLNEFKKKPEEISVYDVLADSKIFKDQKKGDIVADSDLRKAFGDKSEKEILKQILIKGECQIPTAFLNKLREEKKKQVINYIVENSVNPTTKARYTPTMVESEINKLKFNFDPNLDFSHQAEEVLKMLKKVMPISMEKVIIEMEIPGMHCGNFYGSFRKFGKIMKEYFDNDGNLRMHIEVMESKIDDVCNFIKNNSNGEGAYSVVRN